MPLVQIHLRELVAPMRLNFHWVDPIIRPSCSDKLNLLEVAAGPASGEARPRRGLRDDIVVGVCGHR